MSKSKNAVVTTGVFDPAQLIKALPLAVRKLDPRHMARNPVMFVVTVGSVATTVLAVLHPSIFAWAITAWLWFTVVFANLAEAVAEGRGKAQAASLREVKRDTVARRLVGDGNGNENEEEVPGSALRPGDRVLVEAGQVIPGDGDVVEGIATVDESAITGESAPVVRESGGDRCAVTGGTTVLSDRIVVQITAAPGESFVDRMIALVEGASRQKTPNEIALNILLASLTIIFLLAVVALGPMGNYGGEQQDPIKLIALLVCLIPTTIGALMSAIGIAGMDRLVQHNVLAKSGRAVEAAGDIDTLLMDKTGTITFGNRQATEFLVAPGIPHETLAAAARASSLADETPEGRSIVELAAGTVEESAGGEFVAFTAATRMSGLDTADGRQIRKGASDAVFTWVASLSGVQEDDPVVVAVRKIADQVASEGGTPLVVADHDSAETRLLGVIRLSDVVKPGMAERFAQMRAMGIRTVMVTGDNPLTAKQIAAEAGVDDFVAEATPEDKLELLRKEQQAGRLRGR
ncbi:Potassium-transporting ATPase B chain [Mycobacteroides abscessus]|nr:Potassium-transporting ATPase B chain [Mycobacteroides abscessus]